VIVLLLALTILAALPASGFGRQFLVTGRGVGPVHLHMRVAALHRRHLIGRVRPGCEFDPGQRIAPLRGPLRGFVTMSHPNTKVSSISVTGGAHGADGLTVGSTATAARAAYRGSRYNAPGTYKPFAEGFLWVGGYPHARLTVTIDPMTRLVSSFSIPVPAFCE
jgi:hypothetical protein